MVLMWSIQFHPHKQEVSVNILANYGRTKWVKSVENNSNPHNPLFLINEVSMQGFNWKYIQMGRGGVVIRH